MQRTDRRRFLSQSTAGVAALASLLNGDEKVDKNAARAKRVIFLTQSGAPSQIDLFDPKPELDRRHGDELPNSIRQGQRLTTMTSEQDSFPIARSHFKFARHGSSGIELSELLPHTAKIADDICVVRSMWTEAINHDPAITFLQTGSEQSGRPSIGSWLSYGLGSMNENLPAYVVFISGGEPRDQALSGRLWGNAFLPSSHQGVKFRAGRDPVLYLNNPPGITSRTRRRMIDGISKLNEIRFKTVGDPAIESRIDDYELAFRMQMSLPDIADTSKVDKSTSKLYGDDVHRPGSYAANCLLARRLVERGVRCVQLFHRGWDHHLNLPSAIRRKCKQTDQASAGLVQDLKLRGLLKDTLVVWAGEFGRTAYCQGDLTDQDYGRDHHPRCFSLWMAGGGIKPGLTFGQTDDFSYNVVKDKVHVHDLQATILHCLGIDHEQLTYRFQGRDYRLTDVSGNVVSDLLA